MKLDTLEAAFGGAPPDEHSAARARRVERHPDDFRLCACHQTAHNSCVASWEAGKQAVVWEAGDRHWRITTQDGRQVGLGYLRTPKGAVRAAEKAGYLTRLATTQAEAKEALQALKN